MVQICASEGLDLDHRSTAGPGRAAMRGGALPRLCRCVGAKSDVLQGAGVGTAGQEGSRWTWQLRRWREWEEKGLESNSKALAQTSDWTVMPKQRTQKEQILR